MAWALSDLRVVFLEGQGGTPAASGWVVQEAHPDGCWRSVSDPCADEATAVEMMRRLQRILDAIRQGWAEERARMRARAGRRSL